MSVVRAAAHSAKALCRIEIALIASDSERVFRWDAYSFFELR